MIIINSETIAQELLEKCSVNYSTCPIFCTKKLAGLAFNSIYHQVLRAKVSISYHKIYSRHANELVIDLLGATRDPLQQHTEVFVSNPRMLL
ncbi:hypothetical protein EV424DRAFT_1450499 [Suillus variegatus]|nr:hypothetical protein EV424DRAFT_1450499 [Suillus variegatus]